MDQHGRAEDARPPDAVCQDMLASPHYPLPVVTRIVEAPVFAPDGSLVTDEGYHSRSLTYFDKASSLQLHHANKSAVLLQETRKRRT
jgi:hypothetical protein